MRRRDHPSRRPGRTLPVLCLAAFLASTITSCAYYNTFYLAKKYYNNATLKEPYIVDKDRGDPGAGGNFRKSIDYSKKVLSQYPKSKWVDDAYLLWARSLLYDDPLQTINMLQDFTTRYPKSSVTPEARFFLGVAYRLSRKYRDAVRTFDEYLAMSPKHSLVPYAYLERARALGALERWPEAAASARQILERYKRSVLVTPARLTHAEAAFNQRDFAAARADYVTLGAEARNDEERLTYLFREADCLEAAHDYDQELRLLTDAQSHEIAPPTQAVAPGQPSPPPPPNDRYGRIMLRIGTAHMLAGHLDQALASYRRVVTDYPRTVIAAEGQYRVGYAYETQADDFVRARDEYLRVKDIGAPSSTFLTQGEQRATNLGKITSYKGNSRDTVESKAESRFLLAEQYLFQLDKPDRAVQEYEKIEQEFHGTAWEAKALVAKGWVLSRKLDRRREADSLWWQVVYLHPATEAQLAARDFLEKDGATVADSLIKMPVRRVAAVARDTVLTRPPMGPDSLGVRRLPGALGGPQVPSAIEEDVELARQRRFRRRPGASDSLRTRAPADSTGRQDLPWSPPPDTTQAPTPPVVPLPPPDTTGGRPRHGG